MTADNVPNFVHLVGAGRAIPVKLVLGPENRRADLFLVTVLHGATPSETAVYVSPVDASAAAPLSPTDAAPEPQADAQEPLQCLGCRWLRSDQLRTGRTFWSCRLGNWRCMGMPMLPLTRAALDCPPPDLRALAATCIDHSPVHLEVP